MEVWSRDTIKKEENRKWGRRKKVGPEYLGEGAAKTTVAGSIIDDFYMVQANFTLLGLLLVSIHRNTQTNLKTEIRCVGKVHNKKSRWRSKQSGSSVARREGLPRHQVKKYKKEKPRRRKTSLVLNSCPNHLSGFIASAHKFENRILICSGAQHKKKKIWGKTISLITRERGLPRWQKADLSYACFKGD